ncbi:MULTISPECIES: SlyX family protein [Avibacterium]|uniref:Protein SlyX homolog n=1 Tax=Avibacterium paragallinarum TaxID=728 RepID=A0AAE5TFW5_AVIPA|nr:SlyX family protein [Avibacterium paragallinarum]MEE3608493.1 SlyX family protein [Avibacterium paragallinarum]MEE3621806.1 SlyX family protein [Avibacterium paragallinarum]MEE3669545.1 SlyX family protein [Avibacterium paragallinarum]MEE3680186.1 SlyX family protein [Avibacterium paragallinarum]MEE4385285.1 SlyX family protein [Avibacterium paragallinarum]
MQIQVEQAKQIAELETKVAFQEHAIEELNQALIEQQFAIEKMQLQLRHLAAKLKDLQPSNIASQAEETPPPHY